MIRAAILFVIAIAIGIAGLGAQSAPLVIVCLAASVILTAVADQTYEDWKFYKQGRR